MSELPRLTSEMFPEDPAPLSSREVDWLGNRWWFVLALIIGATLGAIV